MDCTYNKFCHISQNGTSFEQETPYFDAATGQKVDIIHAAVPTGLEGIFLLRDVLELGDVYFDRFLAQMFGYKGGDTEFVFSFV